LSVSHAFHSVLMDPMLAGFAAAIGDLTFHPPVIPVVSTVTGRLVGGEMGAAGYWVDQVRRSVRYADAVSVMYGRGVRTFLEVGPGAVLSGLTTAVLDAVPDAAATVVVPALRGPDEALAVTTALAALHVHGTSVDRNGSTVAVPSGSLGVRLQTGDELVLGEARLRIKFDGDRILTKP
jgi:KS-AT-KR-ACP domain-containing polyene macrolide polyketide synthase/pimaricinolide synthase PimS2/candicidin polyketide synthase FscD